MKARLVVIVHNRQLRLPNDKQFPPEIQDISKSITCTFTAKKRKEYQHQAWNVYTADCEMWRTLAFPFGEGVRK